MFDVQKALDKVKPEDMPKVREGLEMIVEQDGVCDGACSDCIGGMIRNVPNGRCDENGFSEDKFRVCKPDRTRLANAQKALAILNQKALAILNQKALAILNQKAPDILQILQERIDKNNRGRTNIGQDILDEIHRLLNLSSPDYEKLRPVINKKTAQILAIGAQLKASQEKCRDLQEITTELKHQVAELKKNSQLQSYQRMAEVANAHKKEATELAKMVAELEDKLAQGDKLSALIKAAQNTATLGDVTISVCLDAGEVSFVCEKNSPRV